MSSVEPNSKALLFFALSWMLVCFGSFLVAGMLPLGAAPKEVRQPTGVLLLGLNVVLILILCGFAIWLGYRDLRWTSVVISGGSIFLLAPFLVQDLPDAIKNGRKGLLLLFVLLLFAIGALTQLVLPNLQ
jgi:type IV secretory pathway VirB2 component (pilin)